jgi:hypothetical protein
MKRLIITFFIALFIAGCGGGGSNEPFLSNTPSNTQKERINESNQKLVAATIANDFSIASLGNYAPNLRVYKNLKPMQKIAANFVKNYKKIQNSTCQSGYMDVEQNGNMVTVKINECKIDEFSYIQSGEIKFYFESSDIENSDLEKIEIKNYTAKYKNNEYKSFNLTAVQTDYNQVNLSVRGWYKNRCLSGFVYLETLENIVIEEDDGYYYTYSGYIKISGRYDTIFVRFNEDNEVIITGIYNEDYVYSKEEINNMLYNKGCL